MALLGEKALTTLKEHRVLTGASGSSSPGELSRVITVKEKLEMAHALYFAHLEDHKEREAQRQPAVR